MPWVIHNCLFVGLFLLQAPYHAMAVGGLYPQRPQVSPRLRLLCRLSKIKKKNRVPWVIHNCLFVGLFLLQAPYRAMAVGGLYPQRPQVSPRLRVYGPYFYPARVQNFDKSISAHKSDISQHRDAV